MSYDYNKSQFRAANYNKFMVNHMSESNVPTRLIPIQNWGEYHPWPPYGGMQISGI